MTKKVRSTDSIPLTHFVQLDENDPVADEPVKCNIQLL